MAAPLFDQKRAFGGFLIEFAPFAYSAFGSARRQTAKGTLASQGSETAAHVAGFGIQFE